MAHLIPPSAEYRDSYLSALAEFQQDMRYQGPDPAAVAADFGAFVRRLRAWADPAQTPLGRVPETILWLLEGPAFIGRVSIRHVLTESLRRFGGHIGCEIRPSRRRQGYGGGPESAGEASDTGVWILRFWISFELLAG